MALSCAGCLQIIECRQFLKCSLCSKVYDLLCANVSEKRFLNIMTKEHKASWKCQECKNRLPKNDNTHTPLRNTNNNQQTGSGGSSDSGNENVTFRKPLTRKPLTGKPLKGKQNPSPKKPEEQDQLIAEIRQFREELRAVRIEMQDFRSVMSDATAAISSCNSRIDELTLRMEVLERDQSSQANKNDTSILEQTIAELKRQLNDRDQDMLVNDIEITGIPEAKMEGPIHIVLAISNKLGVALAEEDIVSAERAGPPRQQQAEGEPAPRPRPLAVRLARRALRDQLLSAARVRRGATTADLNLATTASPCPFYVNERLTRSNRQIFRQAREASRCKNWKYVWTREGRVYAREVHGAPRYRLYSEEDVVRVFGHV